MTRKLSRRSIIATGFAIFSMFFGSGNLIFPIALGQRVGDKFWLGYTGLFITGVLFTLLGLLCLVLFDGDYHSFFNRLGKVPGTFLNTLVIIVIGPLTGIPRATTVLHQVASKYIPTLTLFDFVICFLTIIFLSCYKRERIMPLLGYVISPILITLLFGLIGRALWFGLPVCQYNATHWHSFSRGVYEGYATMDMMAAVHFVPLAIAYLKGLCSAKSLNTKQVLKAAKMASIITCSLLASIYIGLTYIGAQFCILTDTRNPVTIAYTVTQVLLPSWMGYGLHMLFMLAIISTAISLTTIFADFLREDIFKDNASHTLCLLLTLILAGITANGGLHMILRLEKPFLMLMYPPLITLTLCNLGYKLFDFKPVKRPVALTFASSIIYYALN